MEVLRQNTEARLDRPCRRLLPTTVASHFSSLIGQNLARAAQQTFAGVVVDAEAAAVLCAQVVQAYLRLPLKQQAPQASPASLKHAICSIMRKPTDVEMLVDR